MKKANQPIRDQAKSNHIALWQIALEIGVSEPTLIRWLRVPLPVEKERLIYDAITALTEGGGGT